MSKSNKKSRQSSNGLGQQYSIGPKLYVRNLPHSLTITQLMGLFEICGKVIDLHLSGSGGKRTFTRFAFVVYQQIAAAVNAIQLYNQTLQFGNLLSVSFAKNQPYQMKIANLSQKQCECSCHSKQQIISKKKQAKQAKKKSNQYKPINYQDESKDEIQNNRMAANTSANITLTNQTQQLDKDDFYCYEGRPFSQFNLKREEED